MMVMIAGGDETPHADAINQIGRRQAADGADHRGDQRADGREDEFLAKNLLRDGRQIEADSEILAARRDADDGGDRRSATGSGARRSAGS